MKKLVLFSTMVALLITFTAVSFAESKNIIDVDYIDMWENYSDAEYAGKWVRFTAKLEEKNLMLGLYVMEGLGGGFLDYITLGVSANGGFEGFTAGDYAVVTGQVNQKLGFMILDNATLDKASSDDIARLTDNAEAKAAMSLKGGTEGEGYIGDYHVIIKSMKITKDYNKNPAVIITYEWTNNSKETASFYLNLDAKVFQDGIECERPIMKVDGADYREDTSIRPGTTFEFSLGYTLNNTTSDIEVEVSEFWTFWGKPETVMKIFVLEK